MVPFANEVVRARAAQAAWSRLTIRERLRPVREFRHLLVEQADALTDAIRADIGRLPDDVIAKVAAWIDCGAPYDKKIEQRTIRKA